MSAKNKGSETIQDWQTLQQHWWSSLLEGAKQFASPKGFSPGESLKGFGDLFGDRLGSENEAAVERFLAGSKQFLEWVQGLSTQIAARGGTPGKVDDWSALFKQSAGPMFESSNPFLHLFQSLASDGARGLEQFVAGMPNAADAFKGELKGLLGLPAFGFTREQQERAQQFAQAQMDYQEAMGAYNAQMLRASKLSYERLEAKLAEREEPGRQLESLRAVYDLWIDAAEDAYAEVALSADFRAAYGNLVNKQMRLRQLLQAEVERQTAQLGMPSRSELNSVHQRMQEMRRRIRELEDRLEIADQPTLPKRSEKKPAQTNASVDVAVRVLKQAKAAATKLVAAVAEGKADARTKNRNKQAERQSKPRLAKTSKAAKKSIAARRQLNRLA